MFKHIHQPGHDHPVPSEITPRAAYESRRDWLRRVAAGAAAGGLAAWAARDALAQAARPGKLAALPGGKSAVAGAVTMEKVTDYKDAASYNNFYEFGTDKADPARHRRNGGGLRRAGADRDDGGRQRGHGARAGAVPAGPAGRVPVLSRGQSPVLPPVPPHLPN